MHGELAQAIAIATHGTVWLAGPGTEPPPSLESENSTFQYVNAVRFEMAGGMFRPSGSWNGVPAWMTGLRSRGITRLWLAAPVPVGGSITLRSVPDRIAASFSGGGRWFVVATGDGRPSETWRGEWSVDDLQRPDRRIWRVRYEGQRTPRIQVPRPEVGEAAAQLDRAIARTEAIARRQGWNDWVDIFAEARRLGTDPAAVAPYHPDMLPATGYGSEARRLLAMAARAFVFGGMGSWNDLGPVPAIDAREYETASNGLYAAVLQGCLAVVNSAAGDSG